MTTIDERVNNGIALLDEVEPGWRNKIDLDRLDMNWATPDAERPRNKECCCVGGQLATDADVDYYGWSERISGLNQDGYQHEQWRAWVVAHGFETADAEDWDELTAAWKRALTVEPAP